MVPGNKGIISNEKANELSRKGADNLMNRPEPAVGYNEVNFKKPCLYD